MIRYTIPQIEYMLSTMVLIVDTREQNTEAFTRRTEGFNRPFVRRKLDVGDYSAYSIDADGNEVSLENIATIERKMNLTELCGCFTQDRKRFQREFERSKAANMRVHLIVENDNYEHLRHGNYRSQLNPKSLIASFLSWSIRYGIQTHFCEAETTGWLVGEIMYYELREHLLSNYLEVAV